MGRRPRIGSREDPPPGPRLPRLRPLPTTRPARRLRHRPLEGRPRL